MTCLEELHAAYERRKADIPAYAERCAQTVRLLQTSLEELLRKPNFDGQLTSAVRITYLKGEQTVSQPADAIDAEGWMHFKLGISLDPDEKTYAEFSGRAISHVQHSRLQIVDVDYVEYDQFGNPDKNLAYEIYVCVSQFLYPSPLEDGGKMIFSGPQKFKIVTV